MLVKRKFFFGWVAGLMLAFIANSQTLFTYGKKPVSLQEFTRAFEKNPAQGDKGLAVKEYLPLFINYTLKVQDAIDKKMDTLQTQKDELESFRNQLVENYINTSANSGALVNEAFQRSHTDILLGHLLIGFNPADSASVKQAFAQAQNAKEALENGNDFASAVNTFSTDEANRKAGGRAGWITVFSVPYGFETIIYDLKKGTYSPVVKSNSAFHIFKKIDERPAAGQVKIAQIMLVNADTGNAVAEARYHALADSLYNLLATGASFDSLAFAFSNDRTSYDNGGLLPVFGVGTYSAEFEDVAFALAKKGEISKPFKTEYGIHILKLIDKIPVAASLEAADADAHLSQKVVAEGRTAAARNAFLKSLLADIKLKPYPVKEKDLFDFTDSSMNGLSTKKLVVNTKTPLFKIGNESVTAGQWLQFIKTVQLSPAGQTKTYTELLPEFSLYSIEKYVHTNIALFDTSFNQRFSEFRDANLLFEAMEQNVWNKASSDTAALKNWYKLHKQKYRWNKSALATIVTCADSTVFSEVYDKLAQNPSGWRQLVESKMEGFSADSGRYELSQLPIADTNNVKAGTLSAPLKNELDGSLSFAIIFTLLPANEQRNFEDAKGFVISDYQQVLEDKWVAALKRKYPVTINQSVWNKVQAFYK